MSYDIHLLRLSGTGDPVDEAKRVLEAEALAEDRGEEPKPGEKEDERRKALVEDLLALSPSLKAEPYDKGFSYGCVVTSDDPDCHVPDIHLGIDSGFITFSYSADFERTFPVVQRAVAVFAKHGYVAYDPQSEKLLTRAEDFEQSALTAHSTRNAIVKMLKDRGEIVIAPESRRAWSPTVVGWILSAVVVLAGFAIDRWYFEPKRPHVDIPDIRTAIQRNRETLERFKKAPPNSTAESDARKSGARGSP